MPKKKLVQFLRKQDEPLTVYRLCHMLDTPLETLQRELNDLKMLGVVREMTLEQLLRLEK